MDRHQRIGRRMLGALGAIPLASPAFAQDFPSRPIQMVIPWPPGGRTDIAVRLLAPYLQRELGQPVVVINRGGGGGLTGMAHVRSAAPDGYTISSGGIALSSMQYERQTDLTLWDFTWFARIYSTPMVLAVPGDSPFRDLRSLIEFARANPERLFHGNSGTGSSTHLASEAMARRFDFRVTQVPYSGEGPVVVALATRSIQFSLGLMVAFRSMVQDGSARILGVAAPERDPLVGDVATFREAGFDFTYMAFEALHVPNGVPQPVLARLSRAAEAALTDPGLAERFAAVGLNLAYMDGPRFTSWLREWDVQMRSLVSDLGMAARR
jgi:tripartite-type tricarboxylate transporter receptor subunit TctC